LSTAGTLSCKKLSIINTIITSDLDKEIRSNSTQLLIWKILNYLNLNKIDYLDLAGFSSYAINGKEKGISLFKNRWPGKNYYFLYGETFYVSFRSKFLLKTKNVKKLFF